MKLLKAFRVNFKIKIIHAFLLVGIGSILLTFVVVKNIMERVMISLLKDSITQTIIPDLRDTIILSYKLDDEIILVEKARKIKSVKNIKYFLITDEKYKILLTSQPNLYPRNKIYFFDKKGFKSEHIDLKGSKTGVSFFEKETPKNIYFIINISRKFKNMKPLNKNMIINVSKQFILTSINNLTIRLRYLGAGITLLALLTALFISEKFSDKIVKMSKATKIIGDGNFDHSINMNSFLIDELDDLSSEINNMASSLKGAEKMKMEQERIGQELKIATEIQKTLLPKTKPEIENIQWGSLYYSAKEVGGDYYDWFMVDEKHIGIICADVSGKGVPGAFVMAIARTVIRAFAPGELSSAKVLIKANKILKKDIRKGMFVTTWYGILNIETGELNFSNSGHNPTIIHKKKINDIEIIDPAGAPVGILNDRIYKKKLKESNIQLEPGDLIVQYTDGVTEAFNDKEEMFDDDRLYNCIKKNGEKSAQEVVDILNQEVVDFVNGFPQSDDILIVTTRWNLPEKQDDENIEVTN